MMGPWFSFSDGSTLVWFLLVHILTHFILQTQSLINQKYRDQLKAWFLYLQAFIAGLGILLVTSFQIPFMLLVLISTSTIIIEILKIKIDKNKTLAGLLISQLFHLLVLITTWLVYTRNFSALIDMIGFFKSDYKVLIILAAYTWIVFPVSMIIKLTVAALITQSISNKVDEDEIQHAGKYIGIFERVIILTLVLLNQYEAIGFLITGKSIIRMNSRGQTEYVLAGTLMSYAYAILTGILVNYLLGWS